MEEFLNKLYSYEYFGIYLTISIVVLILLFFVIFFLGKKDQREREKTATLKLQQINNEAFKEDSIEEKVEVPTITQEELENDTIIVPNINELTNTLEEVTDEIPEPVLPEHEEVTETNNLEPKIEEDPIVDISNITDEPVVETKKGISEVSPILDKLEEKPLVFNETKEDFVVPKIEVIEEAPKAIETEEIKEEIEVPTFNFDEIVKEAEETKKEQTNTKGREIFSSVYVPKKEEVIPEVNIPVNNDLDFELPTLKKDVKVEEEPKIETPKEGEKINVDKIELPILNDYNLDELSGETYNINK